MVQQTHFMPTDLPVGKKSRARLAESGRRALIFVHGFGGSATGTWDLFSSILPEEPLLGRHDLFFYGYDSLRQTVAYSAAKLLEWLGVMLSQPSTSINSLLPPSVSKRPTDFSYEQVTISAHSMGAVIARRALLDLADDPAMAGFLDLVRIVLFAPAHMGGNVIRLAAEALVPLKLAPVASLLKFRWPTLSDLEPGSSTLTLLREDTITALQRASATRGSTRYLVAEAVIHGQKDKIVNQNPFCSDPPLTPFDGKGHMGVCKPRAAFRNPVEVLLPHL